MNIDYFTKRFRMIVVSTTMKSKIVARFRFRFRYIFVISVLANARSNTVTKTKKKKKLRTHIKREIVYDKR